MNIYSLPGIISFTINFSIGLIVLLNNPRSVLNRWFAAFIFQFALWNISEIIILNSASFENALLAAQILYRVIFLAPAFFVIIAYSFPKNFHRWTQHTLFYIILFAIPVLCLALSFPEFQIQLIPLKQYQNIYYYRLNYSFSPFFLISISVSIIYVLWGSLTLTFKIPRLQTVRQKSQARFLLFALLAIFFIFIIINALRTLLEKTISFYFLSTMMTFVVSLFFLMAILQYRIIKTSRLISSGITYSILSSIILAVYFIIIKSLAESLSQFFQINSNLLNAAIILVIIILIRPISNRLQYLFDRWLHRDIHEYRHNFFNLTRQLLAYFPPDIFFHKVTNFLMKNFEAENVVVFEKRNEKYSELKSPDSFPVIDADSHIVRQLCLHKKVIEFYELNHKLIDAILLDFLNQRQIRLILPLIFENQLLAIIMLARKKHGRDYSEDEIEILSIFINEIAIAFQRNEMIAQLQQKEQQRFRLQKLAALGQLTSGVAHEIRNPLNTISTAAETLLNKKLSAKDQKQLQQYILKETERLNLILKDFLSFSKLRPAKIQTVSIEPLINRVVLAVETMDGEKIEIATEIYRDSRDVATDPDLVYQILLNLGINGIEAIRDRCERDENFDYEQGKLQFVAKQAHDQFAIHVIDNGIGIPEDKLDAIFDPFFTTKKNGTGLGLSIVQTIVDALGGSIEIKSRFGNTEFIISLPQNR